MINQDALDRLVKNNQITKIEKNYIMDMAGMLKTTYNALYTRNQRPHNPSTLSRAIDLSIDRTIKLLRHFEKQGIIAKTTCAGKTMYSVNPFLARKRMFVDKELVSYFNTFE